jgi:Icc-related predicted phosphoesterase
MLVVSDIHGNLTDSIMDYASSFDLIVCLGDLDNSGEIKEECFEFILKLASAAKFLMVPGNCDTHCLQTFLNENEEISIHQAVKEFDSYTFSGYGGTIDAASYVRASRTHFLSCSEAFLDSIPAHLDNSPWLQEFFETIGVEIEEGRLKAIPETPELVKKWEKLRSSCEFHDDEIRNFFIKHAEGSDIWILHTPPFGFPGSQRMGGLSIGSRGILDAITALQPMLTISGHIHQAGKWKLGKTLCLSAPAMKDNLALSITIDSRRNITDETIELK